MLYLIVYFALQLNNLAKVIAAYFYTKKLKLEIIVIAPRQLLDMTGRMITEGKVWGDYGCILNN